MHRHELKSKGRDTKDWTTKSHGMAPNSESIPAGAWIEFTVQCLTDTMAGAVAEWFDYGALRGLGQWRNSGKGRYLWDWLDEKGNVIGGNRSVHKDGK